MNSILVTAAQMQAIEQRLFAAGMPVPALMEKVGQLLSTRIRSLYPLDRCPRVGILLGSGHNGGDGLVVGRELRLEGRQVLVWQGSSQLKPLTHDHARYVEYLQVPWVSEVAELAGCDLLIDAMFGIGLTRPLTDPWASAIAWANQSGIGIVSLDLPSGLHSETGSVMGACIQATYTFCLGLWKRGLWQDAALDQVGQLERIDFGIPEVALEGLGSVPQLLNPQTVQPFLPDRPPLAAHKYQQGHLLVVAGSVTYAGAAVLTGLGARPSGVGMVTVAVPESLKDLIHRSLPEVLVQGCPETGDGRIASLGELDPTPFTAIALGPGLSESLSLLQAVLPRIRAVPLVLDADGLNGLARLGIDHLHSRQAATILTPHPGEFRRLFPEISLLDRIRAAQLAAQMAQATVLLKGARTVIADPGGQVWVNSDSTPALARGGSGDILTGLIGGLLAQGKSGLASACGGTGWHAQSALALERQRGVTGVDPVHLAESLAPTLQAIKMNLKGRSQYRAV